MHGARGGAPKGEANGNYKTGEHTAELREARRLIGAILRRAKEAEDSPSALGQRSGPALKTVTLPADGKVSQASQFLKRALCKVVRERARRRSRVQPPGQNPPISVACNACVNEQSPGADNWTKVPEDWEALRWRWEYSHAAGAVCQILAM